MSRALESGAQKEGIAARRRRRGPQALRQGVFLYDTARRFGGVLQVPQAVRANRAVDSVDQRQSRRSGSGPGEFRESLVATAVKRTKKKNVGKMPFEAQDKPALALKI